MTTVLGTRQTLGAAEITTMMTFALRKCVVCVVAVDQQPGQHRLLQRQLLPVPRQRLRQRLQWPRTRVTSVSVAAALLSYDPGATPPLTVSRTGVLRAGQTVWLVMVLGVLLQVLRLPALQLQPPVPHLLQQQSPRF